MKNNEAARTWEFFAEDENGVRTVIAIKRLKHPHRSIHYTKMEFKDGVVCYGYRIADNTV